VTLLGGVSRESIKNIKKGEIYLKVKPPYCQDKNNNKISYWIVGYASLKMFYPTSMQAKLTLQSNSYSRYAYIKIFWLTN